jgi:hypothetical protein
VGPLIFEGVRCSVHATLMSVSSHYDGVNFDAVGQGYASGKSDNNILAIGSAPVMVQRFLQVRCQPSTSTASTRLPVYEGLWCKCSMLCGWSYYNGYVSILCV